MHKTKFIWLFFVLFLALTGIAVLLLTRLPYSALQPCLNILARDGTLESFTPALHEKIAVWQWLGWLLTISALGIIAVQKWSQRTVADTLTCTRRVARLYWADAKTLWDFGNRALKTDGVYLYFLGAIFVAALLNSGRFLSRPMIYDEAYTFNIFASRPVLRIISDYHLPNNHIFHSLLVHFTTGIFGSAPWAVRLPAFFAGVLLIPAGYLAARAFFDRDTALLSAALIGFTPILVNYATNARGYSLMALFTLLLLALAAYLRREHNRAAWALMVVFAALGFYTLPTMLFPFGALGLWLGLEWLYGKTQYPRKWAFILRLFVFGFVTVLIVILLYAPVILVSGPDALLNNAFIAPIDSADYWLVLSERLAQTWDIFTNGIPPLIVWVLVTAFFVGLISRPRRAVFPLTLLLFSFALVIARRQAPFDRMWLFIVPVFLIWVSAGLVQIYGKIIEWGIPAGVATSLKLILLFLLIVPLTIGGANAFQRASQYTAYSEDVALFLGGYLTPADRVVVDFPLDAPIIYYTRLHGLDDGDVFSQVNPDQLYVLVDDRHSQIPEDLLAQKGVAVNAAATITFLRQIYPVSIYQVEYRH